MKKVIFFTYLCLASCFAAAYEQVHIDNTVIRYNASPKTPAHTAVLEVFLNGLEQTMSYQIPVSINDKLNDAVVYGHKVAVILEIGNTRNIIVLDKQSGKVLDNFWAIFPQLSPNDRFIVYTKWTGRNQVTPWGRAVGVTAIYDLEKTAKDNRTKQEQQLLANTKKPFVSPSRSVGIPILPLGDYNKPEYGWSHNGDDMIKVVARYHWYKPDSVFFMVTPQNGFVRMVDAVYDVNQGLFKTQLYQFPVAKFARNKMTDINYPIVHSVEVMGNSIKVTTANRVIRLNKLSKWQTSP